MIVIQAEEHHEMYWRADQKEPITGCTWCVIQCPQCGYKLRICYETGDHTVLDESTADMLIGHYYNGGPIRMGGVEVKT